MADKQSRGVYQKLSGLIREGTPIYLEEVDYDGEDVITIGFNGMEFAHTKPKSVVKKADSLTVKVDVDVSEALTGLKALQREAKEATKALKELESAQADTSDIDTSEGSFVHTIAKHFGWSPQDVIRRTPDQIAFLYRVAVKSVVLSGASTKELSEELTKREGVTTYNVAPHGDIANLYLADAESGGYVIIEGPATILVNKD